MWGMIISILSGILMSVQGVFNSGVTKQTSVWVAASFVQFLALIVCLCAWFVTGREGTFSSIASVKPVYILSGGIIGAFITYTVIVGMNELGPAKAVIFIVISQIVAAYVIELFGMFGVEKNSFQWSKVIGLLIMIAGVVLFKWKELFASAN